MGHRALVAVERNRGRFDCYRTQRGGTLRGSHATDAVATSAVADGRPLVTGASASRLLALLDPRGDDALLVQSGGRTDAYLVRWLGVPAARDGVGPTVLVPAEDRGAALHGAALRRTERLDCAVRTAKGILGDAVDAGVVSQPAAVAYMTTLVARHPDLPAGAIWLAPDEVDTGVET